MAWGGGDAAFKALCERRLTRTLIWGRICGSASDQSLYWRAASPQSVRAKALASLSDTRLVRLMPPFRLQTLGSLSLHDSSGDAIPGQGAQRRRLALLAAIAVSGDRGRSRDSLLALFWPDASPERARHSLEQLLYAIRTSLDNAAFLGVNPISLNSEVISSDVAEFGRALAENQFEKAVALYSGPFLDTFILPDASEFGQWVDGERARLAGGYARALETLATEAERRGDFRLAAEWWQKRVEHDRYDSRVAQCLMRALDASGNRAQAIKHAAIHERLLRQELGVRAATEVSALAERMRAEPAATSSAIAPHAVVQETSAPPDRPLDVSVAPDTVRAPAIPPTAQSETQSDVRRRGRRISLALVGTAVVAAGLAWALWPSAPPRARSIAVLPFVNLSPHDDNEFFNDGITEEITSQLSAVPTLKVISRTSAMQYRGTTKSLRQIAAELGVAHVLEGSVRREGDRVRITAQLIDAGADHHLWSRSYDRHVIDVISAQDEIAREVGRALEVELGGRKRARGTRDAQAYEFYRLGRFLWGKRTKDAQELALQYYQRAIERDSGYAEPYAGMADAYLTTYQFNLSRLPEAEVYSRMKWAAERALALDDQSAPAHTSFAMALWWQRNWPGAERELRRASELNPGTALSWYAQLLSGMGRLDEAVQQSRRAAELDPLSPLTLLNYASMCYLARDYDRAIEVLLRALELNDAWAGTYTQLGLVYAQKGMYVDATRAASKAVALGGAQISSFQATVAYVHASAGRRSEAEQFLQRAKTNPWEGFSIARAYVALGMPDSAFAWLERSSWQWPHRAVRADPALDPLRADPRFAQLSAKVARSMGIQ
jgi:TolB-like protein/DNA-binding SARP family transcriptional activator/Flp pilus assembly protein TadD